MIYSVKPELFYRGIDELLAKETSDLPSEIPTAITNPQNCVLCQQSMSEFVQRYELSGKRILSAGAGRSHEEYWLWKAGCQLELVDICQGMDSAMIPPFLESLPKDEQSKQFQYHVTGLENYLSYAPKESFDVLYISSFAPDEHRREDIQAAYRAQKSSRIQQKFPYLSWPKNEKPFSELIMESLKMIRPGGMFFMQSYRGGIDFTYNPHFHALMKRQLQMQGVQLLEIHYFNKSPGIILLAGLKGSREEAQDYLTQLRSRKALTTFHGRYPYPEFKTDIGRIDQFEGASPIGLLASIQETVFSLAVR